MLIAIVMEVPTSPRALFWSKGFALIREAVLEAIIRVLREVADDNLSRPSCLQDASGETSVGVYVYHTDPRIGDLLVEMGIAHQAADVLGSQSLRLFYDQFLDKKPGEAGTVWHQDHTYWPISGTQCCTSWLALDNVALETGALRYCRSSHASGTMWRPASRLKGDDYWASTNLPSVPNIDKEVGRVESTTYRCKQAIW